ncbi:MAG TPA: hypothetical protein VFW75_17375, partial [Acetobacteraceae bacterium]|nr:hypothetical protein [Acetobacteraceae bacterium]
MSANVRSAGSDAGGTEAEPGANWISTLSAGLAGRRVDSMGAGTARAGGWPSRLAGGSGDTPVDCTLAAAAGGGGGAAGEVPALTAP